MADLQEKIMELLIEYTSTPIDVCQWLSEKIDVMCHQDMIARHFGIESDDLSEFDSEKYLLATKELKDEE